MSPTEKEFYEMEANVKVIRHDLDDVKNDVGELKTDVKDIKQDIGMIKDYMATEKGGRAARAELQAAAMQRLELSWSKIGALGCLIGAIAAGLPFAIHFFIR